MRNLGVRVGLLGQACAWSVFLAAMMGDAQAGLVEDFEASEFEFLRGESNLPHLPFAWLGVTSRGETEVETAEESLLFDQVSSSEFLALPVWIGRRDMFLLGEYVSMTRFTPVDREGSGTDVYSTGLGAGWLRQASPDWQYGVIMAPFGSSALDEESSWMWQVFGGAGAIYYGQTDFLWIFAGVMDYTEDESFVFPYVGFSWTMSPEWALNMILPWPSVSYAPTRDLLLNVGAIPSGGTWRLDEDGQDLALSLNGWDVGGGAEYRVWKYGWIYARAGLCGFRGMQVNTDGNADGPEVDPDSQPFFSAGIDMRM
jgi:hypothetical protein